MAGGIAGRGIDGTLQILAERLISDFSVRRIALVIENLHLRGVSSYSPDAPTTIGPLKRVNMLYGQNGTGKSTIGNYLQAPSELCYRACSMVPTDPEREILVYNHTFMEMNFHEDVAQPGVFTLNAGNIEVENALNSAQASIKLLSAQQDEEMAKGTASKTARDVAKQALKDSLWKLKTPFDGSPLAYCLQGFNTKERLLEKLQTTAETTDSVTTAELMTEATELQSATDAQLASIQPIGFPGSVIEQDPIFREVITGTDNSYLAGLIHALGHSDWVQHALTLPPIEGDLCPFCQRPLPQGFHDEITKIFDKSYEQRLQDLANLHRRYAEAVEQTLQRLQGPSYRHSSFQLSISNLTAALQRNLQIIEKKATNPSMAVELEVSAALVDTLNEHIAVEQEKIDAFNLKLKNKQTHLAQIKERFWGALRASCGALLDHYAQEDKELAEAQQRARDNIESLRVKARAERAIIAQSKAAITNIDQSVDSINHWLRVLGLKGFELTKEEGDVPQYRLQRPQQREGVFKTLSEGEKTLISFLYFLEVCNGELNATAGRLISDRIIVIDDPISSLSHNYVYDIASLIKRHVLSPKTRFKQIIILTHNLFFFHEMVKLMSEDVGRGRGSGAVQESQLALFRITKSEFSTVVAMQPKDIQNDYQSFWQAIKDALNGRTSATVIPNMMRNILEYYFTFVHRQDKLAKALEDLSDEDPQFRSLYRYINRESHADAVNITDFGEIDPTVYVERFRQVFVRTDFQEHYDKMMA